MNQVRHRRSDRTPTPKDEPAEPNEQRFVSRPGLQGPQHARFSRAGASYLTAHYNYLQFSTIHR